MVSAKFCTFIASIHGHDGVAKLAVILESWKRIPQDFEFQTQKLLEIINSCPSDEEKSALVWMLSRNLRARPVDMAFC